MLPRGNSTPRTLLLGFGWLYLGLLATWGVSQHLWGDAHGWLFFFNVAGTYLFLPAPVILAIAIVVRKWKLCAAAVLACAGWTVLFGNLYWPNSPAPVAGPQLTVMTYNVLKHNRNLDAIIDALRASDADVIAIYELNQDLANLVRDVLSEEYPHQHLDPDPIDGSGLICRFPIEVTDEQLPGEWQGRPFIYRIAWQQQAITVVCAHPYASHLGLPWRIYPIVHNRDNAVRSIQRLAASHTGPLIVPLDLNSTPQNTAYKIMASVLQDAWQTAGSGLGHTFPGADSPGSSRPHIAGMAVPMWLIRIDYVFHSRHFIASEARFGPWDGFSDHRPVLAKLILQPD